MIDVITYCPDLEALRAELVATASPYVSVDEETGEGRFNVPMTPIQKNGNESIALLRVTDLSAVQELSGLQVLASAPAGGVAAFTALFEDPAATAIYDRVYDQTPVPYVDEDGVTRYNTPGRIFGAFA